MLFSTITRSSRKDSSAAIHGQELPSIPFPIMIVFKSVSASFWVGNYFSPYNMSIAALSPFPGKVFGRIAFLWSDSFNLRTRHDTHILTNYTPPLQLIYPFHSSSFYLRTVALRYQLHSGYFSDHYSRNLSRSRVNCYLPDTSPCDPRLAL